MPRDRRRICFVTGARAEFGLMVPVLRAVRDHPALRLQLIVTGMHLDARHGKSIDVIRGGDWRVDAVVPWSAGAGAPADHARAMGLATTGIAQALRRLRSDVVLVVGDRVEAFAAAAAAHVSQRVVAHVHGGDRAMGQVDDALRHAITKLAHVHFPATRTSAARIRRLGEDQWRIHRVGTPGLDGLNDAVDAEAAVALCPSLRPGRYALLVLHPTTASVRDEERGADALLSAVLAAGVEQIVAVYPNNDPGSQGIMRCWRRRRREIDYVLPDVPRGAFLALMKQAAMMAGNSSAGIIEAASFAVPVVNVGPRQLGRERSGNVVDVACDGPAIQRAVAKIWNRGRPRKSRAANVYAGRGAGKAIANVLARLSIDARLLGKLIAF